MPAGRFKIKLFVSEKKTLDIYSNQRINLVPAFFELIMTNRSASKQHGLHSVAHQRPKSKLRVRKNKAKASARKAERRALKKVA